MHLPPYLHAFASVFMKPSVYPIVVGLRDDRCVRGKTDYNDIVVMQESQAFVGPTAIVAVQIKEGLPFVFNA